jgi:Zn-dependent protease
VLNLSLPDLLQTILIIVASLTVHEFAHSLVALRLGDDTPRLDGRLTLNPLRHIDLVGFILLVVAGFGWAKPVRIDRTKLKRPTRDENLIAVAGPVSNLLLALAAAGLLKLVLSVFSSAPVGVLQGVFDVFTRIVLLNVSLALFNILPIPPLDGSHLVFGFLSKSSAAAAATYFRYGSFALLALILVERVTKLDILPIARATRAVAIWMYGLFGMS